MGIDAADRETRGAIAAYYDSLCRFLDFARRLDRGGGAPQGSTHRFLAGDGPNERPTPERLDHLVLEAAVAAGLARAPAVLDAGCGLGGTIFHWQARTGGTYVGLTLSSEQRRRAAAEALRRGIDTTCRFYTQSYHDPIAASYDAVIAIESLAHSVDPGAAVANLSRCLAPGGLLLIVDDMPIPGANQRLLELFRSNWRCPVLFDAHAYVAALTSEGLEIARTVDLTSRLRPRSLSWLRFLIAALGLARIFAVTRGARDVIGALRGGFALEALYRTSAMHYRLIVARRLP